MAVITEQLDENHVLHYSNQGFKIRQIETGFLFNDAGDFIPCEYTYEETNIPIDSPEDPEEELDWEMAMRIITGEIEEE